MQKYDDDYEYDNGFKPKEVILKDNYKFYNRNIFFRFFSFLTIEILRVFLFLYQFLYLGLRVSGKKNIKGNKKGKIIISNHCMNLDAFYIPLKTRFAKTYVTVLQSNLGFPIFSPIIRIAGAVPIPTKRSLLKKFNEETKQALKRGNNVLIFPEAKLNPYCDHIRAFQPGAFHYALKCNCDIIPIVYTFHKPKGWYKITRGKKPVPKLNYLPIYKMPKCEKNSDSINMAINELQKIMNDFLVENSDYFK